MKKKHSLGGFSLGQFYNKIGEIEILGKYVPTSWGHMVVTSISGLKKVKFQDSPML